MQKNIELKFRFNMECNDSVFSFSVGVRNRYLSGSIATNSHLFSRTFASYSFNYNKIYFNLKTISV